MSIYFDAVTTKFIENMNSFQLVSSEQNGQNEAAVFTNGKINVKIVYSPDVKRFYLFNGEVNCSDDDYTEIQSYFFDTTDDEASDVREAASVANEFSDTLGGNLSAAVVPTASRKPAKKDKENDEASAVYFVNRIPNVLPECREPLLQHKEHYEMLLPNKFCDEVVNAAVAKLLSDKSKKSKAEELFKFLENMYNLGDMDVKSIITMTILNSITGEERIEYVEGFLSSDMCKAWRMARRYIGKEVKPEKESKYQEKSKEYRSQLENKNR
jgi:hypothetical protein